MVDQPQDDPSDRVVAHARGNLKPEQLPGAIKAAWDEALSSNEGRAQVAAALNVPIEDVHAGPPPLALTPPRSGFTGTELLFAVEWAGLHIAVPVLAGLAKDVVKDRLLALWRRVLLPSIRQGNRAAINEERPLS